MILYKWRSVLRSSKANLNWPSLIQPLLEFGASVDRLASIWCLGGAGGAEVACTGAPVDDALVDTVCWDVFVGCGRPLAFSSAVGSQERYFGRFCFSQFPYQMTLNSISSQVIYIARRLMPLGLSFISERIKVLLSTYQNLDRKSYGNRIRF